MRAVDCVASVTVVMSVVSVGLSLKGQLLKGHTQCNRNLKVLGKGSNCLPVRIVRDENGAVQTSMCKHCKLCGCSGNGFVGLAYLAGWSLVQNLSWVGLKLCYILASGLENRGYLDALDNICFNLPPSQLCFVPAC